MSLNQTVSILESQNYRGLPPEAVSADYSEVTVILPTLNECGSIGSLLEQLERCAPGATFLVVDDGSTDGTPEAVRLAARNGARCELLDRKAAPVKGIAASVLDGCRACRTPYLVVMDADLQHPPELVPRLFAELRRGADVVVACRESIGGKFSLLRVLISSTATTFARARLAFCGVRARDPLSGFFALRTEDFLQAMKHSESRVQLSGYKILFDYLKIASGLTSGVSSKQRKPLSVTEIEFDFGERVHGESKLRLSHAVDFFRSIIS